MARKRKGKGPSTDQVRAWLGTVIAPLLRALEVERERCRERSWSFRPSRQDFEFLWATESVIAHFYRPNLTQFLRYQPRIREIAADHDAALAG